MPLDLTHAEIADRISKSKPKAKAATVLAAVVLVLLIAAVLGFWVPLPDPIRGY